MADPTWTYNLTITGTPQGRGAPPVPDPGIDAIVAACQSGLTNAGIPAAGDTTSVVTVVQSS